MWKHLFSKERTRRKALVKASSAVMRDYLETPLPSLKTAVQELEIVALDLETTGLDPTKDSILSIGLVEIRNAGVQLNTAWHRIVRIDDRIPESSAVIHHITDDQSADGTPLEELLPELLKRLAGKVMLVHYSRIEQSFIDRACRDLYGSPFVIATIDTLDLGQRLLQRRSHTVQTGNLRLFNLRPLFGLPMYKAHNALYDALATAELFLAMTAELAPKNDYKLRDVIS